MSYFVTITFDLHYASISPHGRNVYKKITDDLDTLNYPSYATGKKRRTVDLPSNTYVAEFQDDGNHQSEITDFVAEEIRKIFAKYHVKGKFFIAVGKSWHWKVGTF
ncbi:hypothetical protein ACQ5SA_14450 [Stenotrophomonas indicatrix]